MLDGARVRVSAGLGLCAALMTTQLLLSAISKARITVTGRSTAADPANESIFKVI